MDFAIGKPVTSKDGGFSNNRASPNSDDICADNDEEEWVSSSPSTSLFSPYPPSHPSRDQGQVQTSTSVYSACVSTIFTDHTKLQFWQAGPINVSVSASLHFNDTANINLTHLIEHPKHPPRKPDDSSSYFISCSMNQNDKYHPQLHHLKC